MLAERARPGSALLEVLIALVVLALSGTALITLLGQTARSIENVARTERVTRQAADQLAALATLDGAHLRARVGRTTIGAWSFEISDVTSQLFDVAIAASDTSSFLLRTTLYRPDSADVTTP